MSEKKKPLKVPVILQMEALECGAASLAMILAYYKKWVPLEEVRKECGVSRDGSTALNIVRAAKRYGLEYKALRYGMKSLQNKVTYPAIVFWNMNHFLVLDGFHNGYAYINDPAEGRSRVPIEEFSKGYSGICLTFQPGESFEPGGRPPSSFSFLKNSLRGNRRTVLAVMITGALAMIAGTLIPIISRVYTDYILSGEVPAWYDGFLLFFAAVILFQLVAQIINLFYVTKATGKIAVTANASFMHHVFRMPMEFFSQRFAGDLAQRAVSNDMVAATLIGRLAPVLMNLILLAFYLFVMFQYSVVLSIVGIVTVVLNLCGIRAC